MTHHVRDSYRHHRKATLGVATVLVVVVAAVVIPLATAAGKTYTLSVNPTSMCASATNGGASTVLTLKNTGSPQSMGSAEVYFPPNTVHEPSSVLSNTTTTTSGGPKDIIRFNNLGLAPNQSKVVTVSFKASANFSASITAVVKQANNFNDSGGGANLFTVQGSFPTLRVVQCVTVSGRIYQDRNLDNTYTTGTGAFLNSDVPKAWTATLYGKDAGAPASSYTVVGTATGGSASDLDPNKRGRYTFTQVPGLRDYKICVTATSPDTGSKWATQIPTGNTECATISSGGPASAANRLPNLSADALTQDFQVVPVVGPFGQGDSSTVGGYEVIAGTNTGQKPDDFYVQDTWVDSNGGTNFRFSPITVCTQNCPTAKIFLLEKLTTNIALSKLGGQQASLKYDDVAPFLDAELKLMPYCNFDPRSSATPPFTLATSGVIPDNGAAPDDTSCIVTGEQSVIAGGNVHVVYRVYTAYDGARRVG